MLHDIYPILKLIIKYNNESTQKDNSYKNVINNKISQAYKVMARKSSERDIKY